MSVGKILAAFYLLQSPSDRGACRLLDVDENEAVLMIDDHIR